jgi:hypothetical protein
VGKELRVLEGAIVEFLSATKVEAVIIPAMYLAPGEYTGGTGKSVVDVLL